MRILIHGINYAPELTGIGKYTGEMAEWLAKKGHEVHVITALPYYPEWRVHEAYRGKRWHKELQEGVWVHRVPLYVPSAVSAGRRILHEFSFLIASLPYWFRHLFSRKFDVIFCIAPPFHLALMPLIYKGIRGTVLINHIQDLQVDAARDLGMIRNKTFLKLMFGFERFLLRRSTSVSTISEGMKRKVSEKGIPLHQLLLLPNWVDSQTIYPLPKEKSLRSELGFSANDKIVLYSGNLGEKQGLEAIVRVASAFDSDTDVKFVICGTGGARDKLMRLANESGLKQVYFFPLQAYAKLSALLAMADLHLVLQKGTAADLVMPSKLTGILAAGGCALATALPGTSLYEVMVENNMGIVIPPEDDLALEQGIRKGLYEETDVYKRNARKYAEKYLEKGQVLQNLEWNLITLVEKCK